MDARRHLKMPTSKGREPSRRTPHVAGGIAGLALMLCGCASGGAADVSVVSLAPAGVPPETGATATPAGGRVGLEPVADSFRPYLSEAAAEEVPTPLNPPVERVSADPTAVSDAERQTVRETEMDSVVGGVRVFAWAPGRVYDVRTAPLRVTVLTLAPGETVTAKAAGDTVRWQIGESVSGEGASVRSHVLIKPLQTGLETNLVLTTSQRVYLLSLKSGRADRFDAAVAWDRGALAGPGPASARADAAPAVPMDAAVVTPTGPIDTGYRIRPRGRAPRWVPTAVFDDGVRTFITLPAAASADDVPVLFVGTGDDAQLVNYRQAGPLLIVDRVFDRAELRLGARRPVVVEIERLGGGGR